MAALGTLAPAEFTVTPRSGRWLRTLFFHADGRRGRGYDVIGAIWLHYGNHRVI